VTHHFAFVAQYRVGTHHLGNADLDCKFTANLGNVYTHYVTYVRDLQFSEGLHSIILEATRGVIRSEKKWGTYHSGIKWSNYVGAHYFLMPLSPSGLH